jgi:hypothetical protein
MSSKMTFLQQNIRTQEYLDLITIKSKGEERETDHTVILNLSDLTDEWLVINK